MKCTNGVDGISTEEDGANVCTPNEFAPETKRLSFKADSRSPLSDMQMQRHTIEVFKHLRHKNKKRNSLRRVFRFWYKSNTVQPMQSQLETKISHEYAHCLTSQIYFYIYNPFTNAMITKMQ